MEEKSDYRDSEPSLFVKQMLEVEVFPNLSQQVIMTTEDRIKLCLKDNIKKAGKKNDWIAPFSLLIAIITVFATSSFKDSILSSKTWEAIFIIVGIGSFVWFILTIRNAFYKVDIDRIINELKANQKPNS